VGPYLSSTGTIGGTGALHIDTPMTACVDYSAGAGEKLVAYRRNTGDKKLMKKKLLAFPSV
jgi:hypothetical protein